MPRSFVTKVTKMKKPVCKMKFLQRVVLLLSLSACTFTIMVSTTTAPAWADGGEGEGDGGEGEGADGASGESDGGDDGGEDSDGSGTGGSSSGGSGSGGSGQGNSGSNGSSGGAGSNNGTTGYQTGFWSYFNNKNAKSKTPIKPTKSKRSPLSVVIRNFKKSGKGRFLDANITKKNRVSYYKVTFIRPNGKVGSILVPVRSKSNGTPSRSKTNFNRN